MLHRFNYHGSAHTLQPYGIERKHLDSFFFFSYSFKCGVRCASASVSLHGLLVRGGGSELKVECVPVIGRRASG